MKDFIYTGPIGCAPLPEGDIPLFPGKRVTLPEDNPYVKTLIAKKFVVAVEPEPVIPESAKRTAKEKE